MRKVSRRRRAEITCSAKRIRQRGQQAGWEVESIAAEIVDELPEVTLLEAWRLAHGWTRAQVIDGIAALYLADGLAVPALNSSMVCRWEHGKLLPCSEYVDALCRLYQVAPDQLGLPAPAPKTAHTADCVRRSRAQVGKPVRGDLVPQRGEAAMHPNTGSANGAAALAAVCDSIQLGLEVEGPAGCLLTREQVERAIECYALAYSAHQPGILATEVQRCRALVAGMLSQAQPAPARDDLRRLAGWLSALLGNLAFHLANYPAASIHLGAAEQLGASAGDARLVCWSLGAQSMLARYQQRYTDALDLARKGLQYTTTRLSRAQTLAWAELPALARLGAQHRSEVERVLAAARDELDADPDGEQPGRFGFDVAEFELHAAEACLVLEDPAHAATHAQASLEQTTLGRPGWAAATLLLAASEAQHRRPDQAADLAMAVLDTIPPDSLRETARQRLTSLDRTLGALTKPGHAVCELHERLCTLPTLLG